MNWSDIAKIVAPLAPTLGGLLGGPMGAAAGGILGAALGVGGESTPDAVGKAIEAGGDAVKAAVEHAEAEVAAKWGYLTEGLKTDAAQSQTINETMRAEIASGVSFWHWRHLLGYCVVVWTIVPLPLIGLDVLQGDSRGVQAEISLAAALLPYFTIIAALLGYVAADTTRRMTTAIVGDHAPTLLGTIAKAIKR